MDDDRFENTEGGIGMKHVDQSIGVRINDAAVIVDGREDAPPARLHPLSDRAES